MCIGASEVREGLELPQLKNETMNPFHFYKFGSTTAAAITFTSAATACRVAHSAAAMGRLDDAGTSRARVSSATSSATSSSSSDVTGSTQAAAELPDDRRTLARKTRVIALVSPPKVRNSEYREWEPI